MGGRQAGSQALTSRSGGPAREWQMRDRCFGSGDGTSREIAGRVVGGVWARPWRGLARGATAANGELPRPLLYV
jgi:hypothetical protein